MKKFIFVAMLVMSSVSQAWEVERETSSEWLLTKSAVFGDLSARLYRYTAVNGTVNKILTFKLTDTETCKEVRANREDKHLQYSSAYETIELMGKRVVLGAYCGDVSSSVVTYHFTDVATERWAADEVAKGKIFKVKGSIFKTSKLNNF